MTAEIGISGYAVDSTQGPAFATANFGATLYRTYLVWHKKIDKPKKQFKKLQFQLPLFYRLQSRLEYEVNLLERTPIPVIHGKAILKGQFPELTKSELFQNKEIFDYTNEDNYEIAVIQNCEVTTNKNFRLFIWPSRWTSKSWSTCCSMSTEWQSCRLWKIQWFILTVQDLTNWFWHSSALDSSQIQSTLSLNR